jgi:hypothetical protein
MAQLQQHRHEELAPVHGIASSFFEIGPVSFLDSDGVYGATA